MLVVVGRITRAHGVKGELTVDIRSDEPERRFAPGSTLVCDGQVMTVASSRHHSGRLLVAFEGIADRTAAEALRGRLLEAEIDPGERPDDPEEFYVHQLVGLHVRAHDESIVGMVTAVVHGGAQDTLVIDAGAHEVLVPFVSTLVPTVDLANGYLRLNDLPGLLDPDAAESVDT